MSTMTVGFMRKIITDRNISSEAIQQHCLHIHKEVEKKREEKKKASGIQKLVIQREIDKNYEFMRTIIKVDNTRGA